MSGESPVPTGALESEEFTATSLKVRLYVMMFLQYFVQGSYLPVITEYLRSGLDFTPAQIGYFSAAIAVGPLLAPFVIGQLVDRHFPTQHVLCVSHLLGGVVMLIIFGMSDYWPILILGAVYSTLYIPTMMLTNSLAFHHLKNREREFPLIRLWGTIGFVVPLWLVEIYFLSDLKGDALDYRRGIVLVFSGVSGLVMGLYSLTLPHTPPSKSDKKELAPGKVIRFLRHRNFLALVLVSLLVAVSHKYFFVWNSPFLKSILRLGDVEAAWEGRISSIGQIFEVVVMVFLGFSIKRYGFKWTMAAGAIAYLVRCLIFTGAVMIEGSFVVTMTLVCLGQALHGFCFGCFLAAAYMYVDRVSPIDVRGSMQTFYGTFVVGLGLFFGGMIGGWFGGLFETGPGEATLRDQLGIVGKSGLLPFYRKVEGVETQFFADWPGIWLAGAAISAVALLAFLLFFPNDKHEEKTTPLST
jgi:nucleoside transporter